MKKVQLTISDEEHGHFVQQAGKEGMALSAWLKAAAYKRLEDAQRAEYFASTMVDVGAFFRECDSLERPESEPDWEDHLKVIKQSRLASERA